MTELLPIGEVAAEAGLATSTLRYYDDIGLVPATARVGSRRRYHPAVLGRLQAIALCRRAGFTLAEIRCLLDGGRGWPQLAAAKETELTGRIGELQDALAVLRAAVACGCERLETCERTGHVGTSSHADGGRRS